MSAFDALGEFRSLRRAIIFCFWLKPGSDTGFQEGISHPAGCDSGRCPENPQPLKRLAKLSVLGAVVD